MGTLTLIFRRTSRKSNEVCPPTLSTPILSFSTRSESRNPCPVSDLGHSRPVNIFRVNGLSDAPVRVIRIVDNFF